MASWREEQAKRLDALAGRDEAGIKPPGEPDPKEWMPLNEAVEHVMRSQKCSRRTARRLIAKFARQGKLAAIGINTETDEYEKIPAEVWPLEREL